MKRSTGLTILELLVVVLVVAILASIATPNFLESSSPGEPTGCRMILMIPDHGNT